MDLLIAARASVRGAILVHRDPDFGAIPPAFLSQEILPPK
jgi:predicted nucleic acid-binding protein